MKRAIGVVILFVTACSHVQARSERRARWVEEALSYERFDVELFLATDEEGTVSVLDERRRVEDRLREMSPTEGELYAALSSGDTTSREAAEIVIAVRRCVTDEMARAIVNRYEPTDAFFVRYYAMQALASSNRTHTGRGSGAIAGMMAREANDSVRYAGLPLVPQLEGPDRMRVLVEYLRTGSPRLAKAAYAVARSVGREFACAIRAQLTQLGERSALATIEGVERAAEGKASERPRFSCP